MNISFYNGVSGMVAYQEDMDRISHNIANVNTVGFKPTQTAFSDLLYTRMAVNNQQEPLTGHGVRAEEGKLLFGQGTPLQTGNSLDFALLGDGFFAVENADGSIEYTRNGSFDISIEGRKGYLVTADGAHVLNAKGKPIELSRESESDPFDLSELADRLGIYTFPNPYGLQPSAGSCFRQTDSSGEAKALRHSGEENQLLSGALEQSQVELADEMVNVMLAQKAFQFNAKMVQTADQVEEIINNLR